MQPVSEIRRASASMDADRIYLYEWIKCISEVVSSCYVTIMRLRDFDTLHAPGQADPGTESRWNISCIPRPIQLASDALSKQN